VTSSGVELLIVNARPWSEGARIEGADALAIGGGRILALGRQAEIASLAGPATRRWDARGATVTPGLTDAHIHLESWARSRTELALGDCATRAAALARTAAFALAHSGMGALIGRGWNEEAWSELPDRAALDAVTGDRPTLLHRHDFHSLWVNSAALRAAGVTRATPDPDGGRLERDAAGEPTGIVREHAVRLFSALELPESDAVRQAALTSAVQVLHRAGITGVHDFEGAGAMRRLSDPARERALPLRILMHLSHAELDAALALGLTSGIGNDDFRIGAVKLFADGTLGSRTAALLAPYDDAATTGWDLIPAAELTEIVRRAFAGGLSVAIHAIGDRACRHSLDAFEAAGSARGRVALMPRIEHAQLVDDRDLPRFAALGIAASMQPSHCISDRDAAERAWGTRCSRSYPWERLLTSGALLAFGSDAPVEPPDAALGLGAAVTRMRPGRDAAPFVPAQRVSLDVALRAYTEAPARLAGQWPRLGRLAPGALADVVVWADDLHARPAASLHAARVAATFVAGHLVHTDESAGEDAVSLRGVVTAGGSA
jgi:predicted amidohydrolase YtcJ